MDHPGDNETTAVRSYRRARPNNDRGNNDRTDGRIDDRRGNIRRGDDDQRTWIRRDGDGDDRRTRRPPRWRDDDGDHHYQQQQQYHDRGNENNSNRDEDDRSRRRDDRRRWGDGGGNEVTSNRQIDDDRRRDDPRRRSAWDDTRRSSGGRTRDDDTYRRGRRLYVGNVPAGVPEDVLVDFLNTIVATARKRRRQHNNNDDGEDDTAPCVASATVSNDRNFAFVECTSASSAMELAALDDIAFGDQTLRIRWPKDSNAPTSAPSSNIGSERGVPSGDRRASARMVRVVVDGTVQLIPAHVPETPGKLYIGGLPLELADDEVAQLLSTVGRLSALNVVKDHTQHPPRSKGFAFALFEDADATERACTTLHGTVVGGRPLVVERAGRQQQQQPQQQQQQQQQQQTTSSQEEVDRGTGSAAPSVVVEEDGKSAVIGVSDVLAAIRSSDAKGEGSDAEHEANIRRIAPRVVVLANMAPRAELARPDAVRDLIADVRVEAARFGTVLGVEVPMPTARGVADPPGVGRVYVEFADACESLAAAEAFAGRLYAERTVVSGLFADDAFHAGER